jgi:rhodanese-related sulfurtransferase
MEQQITKEPIAIGCITQEELKKLLQQSPEKILIIDVRSPEEYAERHLPSAINITLSELENRSKEFSKGIIIVTVCGKGRGRSAQAADILKQKGFKAGWLCGGTAGWIN